MRRVVFIAIVLMSATSSQAQDAPYQKVAKAFTEITDTFLANEEAVVRAYFRTLRNPEQLKKFVVKMLSFQQKVETVTGVFQRDYEPGVENLVRQMLVNGDQLAHALEKRLKHFDDGFQTIHTTIIEAMYAKPEPVLRDCKPYILPANLGWHRLFDKTMAVATEAAKLDLARYIATFVGSSVFSDGLYDFSKKCGLWQQAENTWGDFIGRTALELVTDAAVDMASDPTEAVVKRIDAELANVEKYLLTAPDGYLAFVGKLCQHHRQLNLQYLRPLQIMHGSVNQK